ncbi:MULTISPECIES: hypothetical protein [unclassified Nostoc]|nr:MULTISPECIES: hypothetical protein [unclassified Nostoc]
MPNTNVMMPFDWIPRKNPISNEYLTPKFDKYGATGSDSITNS